METQTLVFIKLAIINNRFIFCEYNDPSCKDSQFVDYHDEITNLN